jgi:hypothetical protein
MINRRLVLPPLARIAHRRQALAELRLLAFGFPLLIRVARLLFGAGTWGATAQEGDKERRNQKCLNRELLHIRIKKTTIIAAVDAASCRLTIQRWQLGLLDFCHVVFA